MNQIKNSIEHFPVTILSGPRQVGKSTELYNNIRSLGYLVIPKNGVLKLIECKSGSKFSASDIKAFSCFGSTDLRRVTDAVICTTDSAYSITSNVIVLPVSTI